MTGACIAFGLELKGIYRILIVFQFTVASTIFADFMLAFGTVFTEIAWLERLQADTARAITAWGLARFRFMNTTAI